ncbi:MAG: hypothetical protein H6Q73_113 [Firmicutes bacterium]|nr:hypothetical protein [Bacillota bacterium]
MSIFSSYPREVRQLSAQIPRSDRNAILHMYKKLPKQAKTEFSKALKNADSDTAGRILGTDLAKYNIKIDKPVVKTRAVKMPMKPAQVGIKPANDIITRVNRILAVPTSIDPELVAEAARRYEQAVPYVNDASSTLSSKAHTDNRG